MESLKGKRLLILGGSMWKEQIRQFAQDTGIVLIAAGNNTGAGTFEIADEAYAVDSTDAEAMKALIREKQIDGVYLGGSEPVIAAACRYLQELHMPCYTTPLQWDALQNKAHLKELYLQHGLPVVPEYKITEETIDTASVAYPVITKPVDGSGSNGFSVCHDRQELKAGFQTAKAVSASGQVLVEKYVRNDGIVVIGRVSNGEFRICTVEDKYPVHYEKQGSFVVGMLLLESKRKQEFCRLYEQRLNAMLRSVGIQEGPLWIEVFQDGDSYCFNEIGFRYGGSVTIFPTQYFCGINEVASDIYYALTGESRIDGFPSILPPAVAKEQRYCVYALHLKPGRIRDIRGMEELKRDSRVIAIPHSKSIGDTIPDTGSIYQVYGFVHFLYQTEDELRSMIERIHNTLFFSDENGEDLLHRMIDPHKLQLR